MRMRAVQLAYPFLTKSERNLLGNDRMSRERREPAAEQDHRMRRAGIRSPAFLFRLNTRTVLPRRCGWADAPQCRLSRDGANSKIHLHLERRNPLAVLHAQCHDHATLTSKFLFYLVSVRCTKTGMTPMRRDDWLNSDNAEAVAYTFHFQMTSGGGRQACSIRVQAADFDGARTLFRENWPMIEPLARDRLANLSGESGQPSQLCLDIADLANLSRLPRDECQC
jgi:hypothetical protein